MVARWKRAKLLGAPSARQCKDTVIQRFHLWLPSSRISDAQAKCPTSFSLSSRDKLNFVEHFRRGSGEKKVARRETSGFGG